MKQTILVSICFLLLSGTAPKEKQYVFNESQGNMLYNVLEFAKKNLPTSQSPAVEVTRQLMAIDSLEKLVLKQFKEQSDSTKK